MDSLHANCTWFFVVLWWQFRNIFMQQINIKQSYFQTYLSPRIWTKSNFPFTSLSWWPRPSLGFLRLRTCTSCGRLVVPRLAQPDKTVKLSNKAWTGCELLTGDKIHSLWGTGPAEKDTDLRHLEKKKQYIIYTCQITIILSFRKSMGTQAEASCSFSTKLRHLFPLPF